MAHATEDRPLMLPGYPKVWSLGHPAVNDLLRGPVVVQEKIDGSQFSFGVLDGELFCRSKGRLIPLDTTDALFKASVETVIRASARGLLTPGWTYRGEAVCKERHNTIQYGRVPRGNIVLFDIDIGPENRLPFEQVSQVAEELGIDFAPVLFHGTVDDVSQLQQYLELESFLGGSKVEGIVIKNYRRWGEDGKMLMAKLVRDDFKEEHKRRWRDERRKRNDIVGSLIDRYRNERRWEKVVQHLRDDGRLEHSPRDIGLLIREVPDDLLSEESAAIKEALFRHFWPKISRGVTTGLAEWYKRKLECS